MKNTSFIKINGKVNKERLSSRVLEEKIQDAIKKGYNNIEVEAYGQHGIGGRLWASKNDKVYIKITGPSGQRVASLAFPNTTVEIMGSCSDDIGWLNAGATVIVHGNAGNGAANGMAQGKIYVAGNIGARAMTMTKKNPRFDAPEIWALGSVGDYFAEFMAGGVAVVCGVEPQDADNVLGYRPCVGMVGGKIFFRGKHKGYSTSDVKLIPIDDENWDWLCKNLKVYLKSIKKEDLLAKLTVRSEWQLLSAMGPHEKAGKNQRTIKDFRDNEWDKELGVGGLIGDIDKQEKTQIPLVVKGEFRRFIPVWENKYYEAPCQTACPTGIPVQERWQLIRDGKIDEAVDLALSYTPFPASICGYLCPNLCMQNCTRQSNSIKLSAIDIKKLGQKSIDANLEISNKKLKNNIAIIGGGPAGISAAWQLIQKGFNAKIYDKEKEIGGKLSNLIPEYKIKKEILEKELQRAKDFIPHIKLQKALKKADIKKLQKENDFVIFAIGAGKPRILPVKGQEFLIAASTFLENSKKDKIKKGKKIVIIGAGNVGCDVASEAHRLGYKDIKLIDIQKPLSFGEEREKAEKIGATFLWPCFTEEVSKKGVTLKDGRFLPADIVVASIGDSVDEAFIIDDIELERGFIKVDQNYQTKNKKIFAIGDAVKQGLLTDAIGAGRIVAQEIEAILTGNKENKTKKKIFDKNRVTLNYFENKELLNIDDCAAECASCGSCRDCGICKSICPQSAISVDEKTREYWVDDSKCIGCGFCAQACPCGIWNLIPNTAELN